jgi:hypothetical protein
MELVAILRILWDRRIIVGLGVLVAVAAGVLAGHKVRDRVAADSGQAKVRMVLDTADSQLVEAAPKGADSLPLRAALLADTLSTEAGTASIARGAGVPRDMVAVRGPAALRAPALQSPLVSRVSAVVGSQGPPYVVDVNADELTPIITIEANAPDVSRATRLTTAAAATLRSLLVSQDGTHSRGFVLDTVAPLKAKQLTSHRPPESVVMLAGALATFACWCFCVVLGFGAARRTREPEPA